MLSPPGDVPRLLYIQGHKWKEIDYSGQFSQTGTFLINSIKLYLDKRALIMSYYKYIEKCSYPLSFALLAGVQLAPPSVQPRVHYC